MESRNPPPWRKGGQDGSQRPIPTPSIPSKRPADSQEEAWVADEDRFVLQQAKKKAAIRVKGGRARPIDWLAVTLRFIDPTKTLLDEEVEDDELDIVDPEGVFEGLSSEELTELEKDIEDYLTLEMNRSNKEYWQTMKIICNDRRQEFQTTAPEARGVSSVSADVDRLLGPKSYEELETLEKQIRKKLGSREPIDIDYWEHLLRNLLVWKAKAKLRRVSQAIISGRLVALRTQQQEEASAVTERLLAIVGASDSSNDSSDPKTSLPYDASLDPEPSLKLQSGDRTLESAEESQFLQNVVDERRKILKLGYVPLRQSMTERPDDQIGQSRTDSSSLATARFTPVGNEVVSQATTAMYEREVARGVNDDEEIFAAEEDVTASFHPQWANKYKPRKPRYFNRVQMGYEWNKYNQTHYDHDNPPPKVVQGYKFNIFYPDLIDKVRAPTYRIERENGRKRGQSFAPAGEDDTCLIRFIAGPPYEDVAFRIVDKEWDYSAKRERGFRSSFDKGILQLHFQFKKIYYRK